MRWTVLTIFVLAGCIGSSTDPLADPENAPMAPVSQEGGGLAAEPLVGEEVLYLHETRQAWSLRFEVPAGDDSADAGPTFGEAIEGGFDRTYEGKEPLQRQHAGSAKLTFRAYSMTPQPDVAIEASLLVNETEAARGTSAKQTMTSAMTLGTTDMECIEFEVQFDLKPLSIGDVVDLHVQSDAPGALVACSDGGAAASRLVVD